MTCPAGKQTFETAAHRRWAKPWKTTPGRSKPRVFLRGFKFREHLQISPSDANAGAQKFPPRPRAAQPGSTDATIQSQLAGDTAGKAAVPLRVPSTQGAQAGLGVPLAGHAFLQPHPASALWSSRPLHPGLWPQGFCDNRKCSRGTRWQAVPGWGTGHGAQAAWATPTTRLSVCPPQVSSPA